MTCDAPGCREVVGDGVNGLLVPAGAVSPLATALRRLIEDAALRRLYGQRGRDRVLRMFSMEQIIAQTLALYRRML